MPDLSLHSDGVPFAGDSLERSYLFYDRPSRLSSNAPACRGQSRLSGFCCAHRLCIRSPCQHISRMRTFDNNSCAISIMSPRSIFVPGTQHVWWGRREKSRRASTRCDCRGKSRLAGLSPLSGTPSERGGSGDKQKKKKKETHKVGGPGPHSWKSGWATGPHGSAASGGKLLSLGLALLGNLGILKICH